MSDTIVSVLVEVAATLLITLIGVLGTWLTAKIAKKQQLAGIAAATEQVIQAAQITVGELQQTVVEKLKATGGGKLSEAQIAELRELLKTKTMEKLSNPAITLLEAAAVDLQALICGAGENWLNKIKTAG
jgi:hypothetical protein